MITTERLAGASSGPTLGARVGDTIFLSGLTGLGRGGPRNLDEQARGLFDNARLALEALESSLVDVVQARFYVVDWRYLQPLNAAYAEVFPPPYTARTTVRSASLAAPDVLMTASFVAVRGGQNQVLGHDELFKLPVPLAQAGVLAGDRFFGTGLVGVDRELRAAATIGAQTEQALDNQALALEAAGMTPDDIVKLNVFLRDPRHLEGMLGTYHGFFRPPYPALSVSVTTLARPEWLVEVEVIAARGHKTSYLFPGTPEGERPDWKCELVQGLPPGDQAESAAVLCDGWLYSGALMGFDWTGRPTGTVEDEVGSEMGQLRLLLERAGCTPDHVLFTSASVSDWRHAAAFDAAYRTLLPTPGPAHCLVEGLTVHPELLAQVEAIAHQEGAQSAVILAAS